MPPRRTASGRASTSQARPSTLRRAASPSVQMLRRLCRAAQPPAARGSPNRYAIPVHALSTQYIARCRAPSDARIHHYLARPLAHWLTAPTIRSTPSHGPVAGSWALKRRAAFHALCTDATPGATRQEGSGGGLCQCRIARPHAPHASLTSSVPSPRHSN